MLILTGGLVLGETMALWMTAKEECFGLAAMLLVFACGKRALGDLAWKDRYMAPAFLLCLGLIAGAVRMEWEERRFEEELCPATDSKADVIGEIADIESTSSGYRLTLKQCRIGDSKIRRIYCYSDCVDDLKMGMKVRITGKIQLPETAGNPGQFDYRAYCRSQGISRILYSDSITVLSEEYLWIREALRQLGMRCAARIDRISEESDKGILKAILLGNKSDLDDRVYEMYRRNGISHVLAISGLHVSLIGMSLWRGLRKAGLGYYGAGVGAFCVLFAYGSITGFSPSVLRAVSMMGLSFLASASGRTYDVPTAMCIPAVILLSCRPYLLTQASFQLSFLAIGSIFFPGEYLAKRLNMKGWKKDMLISASLQLMTVPSVLYHSYEMPPYGILMNLVVVPLMAYVLLSGLAALAVSFLNLSFAVFFLGGAHCILELYKNICETAEKIPGADLILGRPSVIGILFFYGVLLTAVYLSVKRGTAWLMIVLAGGLFLMPIRKEGMQVTFFDVGQGDGIFLETGEYTMLVDCGSSDKRNIGEECLIPFLKYSGISRVDLLVISHADEDHVNGIRSLLEDPLCGISVGTMVLPDDGEVDEEEEKLIGLATKRGISVIFREEGENLDGMLGERVSIRCLHPGNGLGEGRNDKSLVLQIEYGEFRMLLTGDAGLETEQLLMQSGELMPVTVLKAGHHGSASSTGTEFLNKVRPEVVILSYGAGNPYGHPDADVLARCKAVGAKIYETAKTGAVQIRTDGNNMQIRGWFDIREGI